MRADKGSRLLGVLCTVTQIAKETGENSSSSHSLLASFSGKTKQPSSPVAHLLELGRETRGGVESHPFFCG